MEAILEGKLDDAGLTPAERALLDYVKRVTEDAPRTTPEDVQKLRDAGSVRKPDRRSRLHHALFAFFNRVADAFGVPPQDYLVIGKMTP